MPSSSLLDAKGLLCPLPVLKLRKHLADLSPGESLTMLATDPAAAIDVPHYCQESGHALVAQSSDGETLRFVVRKES